MMKYALLAVLAMTGTVNAQKYNYWVNPNVNRSSRTTTIRVNPVIPTRTTITRDGNTTTIDRSYSDSYYPKWRYTPANPQIVENPYATAAKRQRTKQSGRDAAVIVQEALGGDVRNFVKRAKSLSQEDRDHLRKLILETNPATPQEVEELLQQVEVADALSGGLDW